MSKIRNLTTGSIHGHLVRLSLPLLASSLVQMLYSFVDMAWLGRMGDATAVTASGAASVFVWLASSIALTTKVGAEVTVAHAIGRGEHYEAARYAVHNMQIALIIGTLILLLYSIPSDYLLGVYKLEPYIHRQAVDYLRIVSAASPLFFMTLAMTGIYNASGNPQTPFVAATSGLVMNMLLDPLFIFTFGLGLRGAAIATVISQSFVFLLLLYLLYFRDRLLPHISLLQPMRMRHTARILRIGGPVALMNALYALINMSLGRFASTTGGAMGLLTLTVGGQLEGICWNTAQSFSTGLSTFVSQNYGAREGDRAMRALRITLTAAFVIGLFGFGIYYFLGEGLFGLIVPDAEAIALGAVYLRIVAISQVFSMCEVTFQGFFFGLNRSLPPSLISIAGNVLRIPLALILLPMYSDITLLWWIICGTSVLKGVMAALYYLAHRAEVRLRLVGTDHDAVPIS